MSNKNNAIIAGFFTKSKKNEYFNSMVFFSDKVDHYHKKKLVPFGEYTPWYDTFVKLSDSLDIPLSNLSHGPDTQQDIFFNNTRHQKIQKMKPTVMSKQSSLPWPDLCVML